MDIRDRGSQICHVGSDFSCSGGSWDLSVGRGRREQAWEEQQGQEKGRALRGNFPDALFSERREISSLVTALTGL